MVQVREDPEATMNIKQAETMLGTLRYILDRIRHRKETNLVVFEEGQAVDAEEVGQAQPNFFSRKDKQLTLKKLVKLNQIVGFLSEKYNEAESEEAS